MSSVPPSVATSVKSATMESSSMEPSAMKTSTVESAAVEESMCSAVRAAESVKVSCRCHVHAVADMGSRMAGEPSRMEIMSHRLGGASVYNGSTVRNERMVVVRNRAVMPIVSPMIPTPAVTAKPAKTEA